MRRMMTVVARELDAFATVAASVGAAGKAGHVGVTPGRDLSRQFTLPACQGGRLVA